MAAGDPVFFIPSEIRKYSVRDQQEGDGGHAKGVDSQLVAPRLFHLLSEVSVDVYPLAVALGNGRHLRTGHAYFSAYARGFRLNGAEAVAVGGPGESAFLYAMIRFPLLYILALGMGIPLLISWSRIRVEKRRFRF